MRVSVTILIVLTGAAIADALIPTHTRAQSPRSTWSGIFTAAQAQRGEELYVQRCGQCHGSDLTGIPRVPPFPGASDRTPELVGPVFNRNYNDLSIADLFDRIRISMPQDKPGSLPRPSVAAILAYMLLQGGFPPGPYELSDRSADLRQIRFLAQKP
jgi:mono/diheme cytochrome c family protein